jgi:hypothetical protein
MFPDKPQLASETKSFNGRQKKKIGGKEVLPLMLIQIEFFFLLLRLVQ